MDALQQPVGGRAKSLQFLLLAGLLLLALGLGGLVLRNLLAQPQAARKPPKITVVAPPPLPPPPPKFEKKPDPPKEQKEMKLDQPAPKPEPQPQAQPPELKMDGPAGNAPSAFAAGQITSEDLSKIGGGKTAGGSGEKGGLFNPYTNYLNLAKGELQRYLNKTDRLRSKRYAVEVRLWLTAAGEVSRYELVGSTGDNDTDAAIQQALGKWSALSQPMPAAMPQPIRLRVTTGA